MGFCMFLHPVVMRSLNSFVWHSLENAHQYWLAFVVVAFDPHFFLFVKLGVAGAIVGLLTWSVVEEVKAYREEIRANKEPVYKSVPRREFHRNR